MPPWMSNGREAFECPNHSKEFGGLENGAKVRLYDVQSIFLFFFPFESEPVVFIWSLQPRFSSSPATRPLRPKITSSSYISFRFSNPSMVLVQMELSISHKKFGIQIVLRFEPSGDSLGRH